MSTRKLLLNTFGGMAEVAYFDEMRPNDLLIKTFQDMQPILDEVSALADKPPGKDFRLIAKIPMSEMDRAAREGWLNDKKAWRKWYNDADHARFRVWGKRL